MSKNELMTSDGWDTKWRPRRFSELVGQDQVTTYLKGTLKKRKIPKALLFAGPFGCGKTTTARMYARYINCEHLNACGKCASCKQPEDNHPDVTEINGAESRGIESSRKLAERAHFLPRFNFKVIILDEIHQWTSQAIQAFLKPLEEPPKHTIYLLGTNEPQKLLGTIHSRVTLMSIQFPTREQIVERLRAIGKEERLKFDKEVYVACAEGSGGHVRDAIKLLEQASNLFAGDPKIKTDKLVQVIAKSGTQESARIAMKLMLGMYLGKSKIIAKAIYDVTDPIPTMNQALRMNEYMLADRLYDGGNAPGIWHTADMKRFKQDVAKYAPKTEVSTLLAAQKKLVDTRTSMQAFAVQERSLLLSMLT